MAVGDQIKERFMRTEKQLRAQPWFKRGAWLTSVHPFPAQKPEGFTFQVYKKNWFNDDNDGIHVESYLDLSPDKQKNSYVTFHILHGDTVPGTDFKRDELARPFIDKIYDEVKAWDGYEFRENKYGTQPFTKKLDGTAEGFEKTLAREIGKICSRLGPIMDQTLKTLMATRG
jgi:hypothetical protein